MVSLTAPTGPAGPAGPQGEPGVAGAAGIGVSGVSINSAGHLMVTLTDSMVIDAGLLPTASATPVVPPPQPTGNWTGTPLATIAIPGTYKDGANQSWTFTEPADAINASAVAAIFSMTVAAGTYIKPFNVNPGFTFSITGAGAYKTIFDGRGGFTGGNRLSYGKGFLHTSSPCTITGISFNNCGGLPLDSSYENQAGIYAETFAAQGTVMITRCAFDGNNDGVFVPSAAIIDTTISNCDFGKVKSNGADQSGLTHDVYISGSSLTINNTNFYGCHWGNNVKSRSPKLTMSGGYSASWGGRCIDYPEGGLLTVTGGIYTQVNAPDLQANLMEYGSENSNQLSQPISVTGITLALCRYATAIWVTPAVVMSFIGVTQTWYSPNGAPSIVLNGNGGVGTVTGLVLNPGTISSLPMPPAPASATA